MTDRVFDISEVEQVVAATSVVTADDPIQALMLYGWERASTAFTRSAVRISPPIFFLEARIDNVDAGRHGGKERLQSANL